jgi:hypothetical protein
MASIAISASFTNFRYESVNYSPSSYISKHDAQNHYKSQSNAISKKNLTSFPRTVYPFPNYKTYGLPVNFQHNLNLSGIAIHGARGF